MAKNDKPIKTALPYEDALREFMNTPPSERSRRKTDKSKPGKKKPAK
jgi:hypothetical protein